VLSRRHFSLNGLKCWNFGDRKSDCPNVVFKKKASARRSENPISCGLASGTKTCDYCLEPGKIEAPKCVDLVSKSAIDSDNIQV
jgi:hypothetical protein